MGRLSNVVGSAEDFVQNEFSNRQVQVAVYAAVVFYIVANPAVFKFVESLLPKQVNMMSQLLLHSVIFGFLVYFGTQMIFDPLVKRLQLV